MLHDVNADSARVLYDQASAEIARRDFLSFGLRQVHSFEDPPHIKLLAGLLEKVERGEIRRLMINLPPRHGKSLLCSQIFPAWFLGRNPRKNVIIGTHSSELSEKNSRGARALIEDDLWPFETRLSADSTAVYRWNVAEGGGLYAVGVGGSITGRGADCLILDDVQHDAGSELERKSIMAWFSEVAVPRLEPNGAIVFIGTRFHEDDVFAKTLERDGAAWKVVTLPAIAGENDPLGRAPETPLWPARMPLRELNSRKSEMGSRAFAAQFQQDPAPAGGDLIKREWLDTRFKKPPEEMKVVAALDAATKTGIGNDWSVIAVIGAVARTYFLLDVFRRKVEYPDLRRMVEQVYEKHRPSRVYIEDAANGSPLIQSLKRETKLPIVPVIPKGSKIARLEAVSGLLESRRLQLPYDAPWLDTFERELLAFPGSKHDDQVDALVLGLSELARVGAGWMPCLV